MKTSGAIISVVLVATVSFGYFAWSKKITPPVTTTLPGAQKSIRPSAPIGPAVSAKPELVATIVPDSDFKPAEIVLPVEKRLRPVVARRDPSTYTREERLVSIKNGIEIKYSKTIEAMRLAPDQEKKLRELLILRTEASSLAHDVVMDRSDRRPADFQTAVSAAQAEVDAEIQSTFSPDLAKQIKLMIMAGPRLVEVNLSLDRALTAAGEPIAPEQALPLAMIFMETYGEGNPDALARKENMDPRTDLIPLDEVTLERAAAVLSARQLEALRDELARRNRVASKFNS